MEQAKLTSQEQKILVAMENLKDGVSLKGLLPLTGLNISGKTLQRGLSTLIKKQKVRVEGKTNKTRYFLVAEPVKEVIVKPTREPGVPLSLPATNLFNLVRRPQTERTPVGYNRQFLDEYIPTKPLTFQLTRKNASPNWVLQTPWAPLQVPMPVKSLAAF